MCVGGLSQSGVHTLHGRIPSSWDHSAACRRPGLGRANHLRLSGSTSLAGQLSRRREQMWLVRVRLGRPPVLWMSQSPGSRASASGFLGLGRGFKEGAGEGAGRWGSAAGAGSGRLWLEMLPASLGSTSTYNKKAQLQEPLCAQRLSNPG